MADARVADACRPSRMPPLRWLFHWMLQQVRRPAPPPVYCGTHIPPSTVACMHDGDIARALGCVRRPEHSCAEACECAVAADAARVGTHPNPNPNPKPNPNPNPNPDQARLVRATPRYNNDPDWFNSAAAQRPMLVVCARWLGLVVGLGLGLGLGLAAQRPMLVVCARCEAVV